MMEENQIEITLNGKKERITSHTSVRSLLEIKGINPHVVACELNLNIIKRARLSETILNSGDTLEVIQMVGGG